MPGSARGRDEARSKVPFPALVAVLLAVAVAVVAVRAGLSSPSSDTATSPRGSSPSPSLNLRPLPACRYGSKTSAKVGYRGWRVTLVDTTFRLPKTYAPPGLVSTVAAGFEAGFLIRKVVVPDLSALRQAAEAAGNPIDIVASYRSYQQQKQLFDERKARLGYEQALVKTARPGHSEHQLGTTLDFKTKGARDVSIHWASTPAGRWVAENAWRFGFVQSYPRDKGDVTCYADEPWHYRYVGRGLAAQIHGSGLTTREFLWKWNQEHSS